MAGIMPQTGISIRTLHRIHRNSVHKPRRIIRTDVKTCVWGKLSYCLFIQVSSPLHENRRFAPNPEHPFSVIKKRGSNSTHNFMFMP